jgi:hypothetical protein
MKPLALAIPLGAALLSIGGYMFVADEPKPIATGSIKTSGSGPSADPRLGMSVVNVDWRRDGFGLASVVDVSVRNNNSYPVRVDRVSCRFRNTAGETEEHTQGVFVVVQPRSQKVVREVGLGFVSETSKGLDCRVVQARKDL